MLIFEITIRRSDGGVLVMRERGDATQVMLWHAGLAGGVVDNGLTLTGFTFAPHVAPQASGDPPNVLIEPNKDKS